MLETLEQKIIEWAEARDILKHSTPTDQFQKTDEEVTELYEALMKGAENNYIYDEGEVKDAIGDIVVTLVIQAKMHGFTLGECVQHAYNEISNRTGTMIDGVFVKDE